MVKKQAKGSRRSGSPFEAGTALLRSAKKGAAVPVYLLYGEEGYVIELTAGELVKTAGCDGWSDMGYERLCGSSVSRGEIASVLDALPLFGERRVVWLKDCGLFKNAPKAELVASKLPEQGSTLTLIISEQTVDKRLGLYRKIAASGNVAEFTLFSEANGGHLRQLYDFLMKKAQADGKTMSRETFFYLVQFVGTDVRALVTELEKLSLFVRERPVIHKEDIAHVVCTMKETVAYQLSDAVMTKNLAKALSLLRGVMAGRNEPFSILAMLLNRTRYLLQAKSLMQKGVLSPSLVTEGYPQFRAALTRQTPALAVPAFAKKSQNLLSQHPYVIYQIFKGSRLHSLGELEHHLQRILSTERLLKSGRRSKTGALEDLVVALCR
jgi:DNA polymerase-3 subunit delta